MKNTLRFSVGVLVVIGIFGFGKVVFAAEKGSEAKYKEVIVKSKFGDESDAAFFNVKSKKAVVFVPGFYYSKEDWYFLAERFQQLEIASISLNGKSALDVLGAIDFLKMKGFEKIALVGGCMGGAAVLSALELGETIEGSVDKIVILASYSGSPIKSKKIKKLFIVAKEDDLGIYARVYTFYEDSSEPKKIKVYEGSEHAQALFSGEHRDDLIKSIIDFISK